MAYTAEEFDRMAEKFGAKDYLFRNVFGEGGAAVIMAALSTASSVMRKGVIEGVVAAWLPSDARSLPDMLRATLMESDNGN